MSRTVLLYHIATLTLIVMVLAFEGYTQTSYYGRNSLVALYTSGTARSTMPFNTDLSTGI